MTKCYICGNKDATEKHNRTVLSMNWFFDIIDLCNECDNNETKIKK
jgi:hypothetical protein